MPKLVRVAIAVAWMTFLIDLPALPQLSPKQLPNVASYLGKTGSSSPAAAPSRQTAAGTAGPSQSGAPEGAAVRRVYGETRRLGRALGTMCGTSEGGRGRWS